MKVLGTREEPKSFNYVTHILLPQPVCSAHEAPATQRTLALPLGEGFFFVELAKMERLRPLWKAGGAPFANIPESGSDGLKP